MADYIIQGETLDDIAEAINQALGEQVTYTPAEMVAAIGQIGGGTGIQYNTSVYTQASDMIADTDNYAMFINTYFPSPTTKIYLAVVNNTLSDNLAGQAAVSDLVLTRIQVSRRTAGIGNNTGNTFKVGAVSN